MRWRRSHADNAVTLAQARANADIQIFNPCHPALFSKLLTQQFTRSFNPRRPPISQRATAAARGWLPGYIVSIHAHQFHGGRRRALGSRAELAQVSIHAHQFHGGRPSMISPATLMRCCFNPRPPISWRATPAPPGMRGKEISFNPRPPISWRATLFDAHAAVRPLVSIHAHQFHGGRHSRPLSSRRASSGFNPRPPISWRATLPGSSSV